MLIISTLMPCRQLLGERSHSITRQHGSIKFNFAYHNNTRDTQAIERKTDRQTGGYENITSTIVHTKLVYLRMTNVVLGTPRLAYKE